MADCKSQAENSLRWARIIVPELPQPSRALRQLKEVPNGQKWNNLSTKNSICSRLKHINFINSPIQNKWIGHDRLRISMHYKASWNNGSRQWLPITAKTSRWKVDGKLFNDWEQADDTWIHCSNLNIREPMRHIFTKTITPKKKIKPKSNQHTRSTSL